MKPKISFSEEQKDWIRRPLLSNIDKILDYRGRTPKKLGLSWSDTGFLALSALNVKNGYIDFNADANYGNQELYDRWMGDNHLHKGQVVFTTEAPMGNVAQIPNDDLYILSQRTIAFEVKHDLIREDFLATLLRSPKIFNELTSLSSGGTAKGVSQKSLSNLKVCVPSSLEEQSAIGFFFRTLDDLLVSYKDNLANYQSLKAVMLSKMFPKAGQTVPEIRLDGFEGEWEEKKLGEIVDIVGGGTPDTNVKEYWNGEINWFSPTEVGNSIYLDTSEKRISELGLQKSSAKILPANRTILFTSRAGIGSVGIITKDSTTNQGFQSLVIKEGIDIYFLFSYSSEITRYALKHSAGSTFLEISGKELGKMDIIIPTYEEQQAIGAYFSILDNLINSHQEKITQLETLKKKLLQDMFI